MLELELEDTCSTKRYKLVERLAELPTPRSTPLLVPSSSDSYSKASTKPSLRHLNYNSKPNSARTLRSSASDLCIGNASSCGIRSLSTGEALLCSSRESIFCSKGIAGEYYITSDSERLGENREGSSIESHNRFNRDNKLFPRTSAEVPQQCKRSNHLLEGKKHGLSRTTLRRRSSSTMLRASRQITPS